MKKEYPLAIKLFIVSLMAFNTYVFFESIFSNAILAVYSFLLFPCLFNSWEASEENTESSRPIFLFIDLLLTSAFFLCVLSIRKGDLFYFWCFMTLISVLYVAWNIAYLKSSKLSNHIIRNVTIYNIIWVFSIVLNILFLILYKTQELPYIDYWLLFLFFPWIVTMYIWYRDKVLNTSKINFSDMNVKCYTFDGKEEIIVKKIEYNEEGKITSILKKSKRSNLKIDYYLLPGLIDSHAHIADSPYTLISCDKIRSEDFEDTLKRVEKNLIDARNIGITSIKDFGSVGFNNIHIFNKMQNRLGVDLPRVVTSGCYFCDHANGHFMDRGGIILKTVEDAHRLVEYLNLQHQPKFGTKCVKFMLGTVEDGKQCYEKNFFEIASVFKNAKYKVSVHAFKLEDVLLCFKVENENVSSCVDIIEHIGDYANKDIQGNVLELIKKTGVILTSTYLTSIDGVNIPNPTESVSDDTSEEILIEWHNDVKVLIPKLINENVKIAIGTDCGLYGTPCDSIVKEIDCIADLLKNNNSIISNEENTYNTLRLMYNNSAEALGLEHRIGKIKVGYYCDFVLYDRDPLLDRKALEHPIAVYISGKRVK